MTGARIFSPGDTLTPRIRDTLQQCSDIIEGLVEPGLCSRQDDCDCGACGFEDTLAAIGAIINPDAPEPTPAPFPLCSACADSIGGACAGPDAPWRPATEGEACGAYNCCMRPDDDEGGAR